MTNPLDPRRNAYRPDLADIRLKGGVSAGRFVAGTDRVVTRPAASLKKAPDPACGSETEALFGELFRVLEETGDGWSWGQLAGDGYVGWIETLALAAPGPAATHWVSALRTFRYPRPDMKTPPLGFLSFASLVSVKAEAGRFVEIADGSFVVGRHLAPLAEAEPDFVAVAERFLGTP
ncbi:MAG: peptidase P60, partial [Hyphomicrobiales bacterium]